MPKPCRVAALRLKDRNLVLAYSDMLHRRGAACGRLEAHAVSQGATRECAVKWIEPIGTLRPARQRVR